MSRLFIPMRGCEAGIGVVVLAIGAVIYPHEGL